MDMHARLNASHMQRKKRAGPWVVELIYCISVGDRSFVSSNCQVQERIIVHDEGIVVVTVASVYVSNECYKDGCVCKSRS